NSGLIDVASNQNVLLYLNNGIVEGRVASSTGALVFTLSTDNSGNVTLDQILALKHPVTTNPDDAVTLSANTLIHLTRSDMITDKDGDTANSASTIDIAQSLSFKDDGPSISLSTTSATDSLIVDETTLTTNATADFS